MNVSLLIFFSYTLITKPSMIACALSSQKVRVPQADSVTTPASVAHFLYGLVGPTGLHVTEYLDSPETTVREFTIQVPTSQEHPTITGLSLISHSTLGNRDTLRFNVHNGSRVFSVSYTLSATLPPSASVASHLLPATQPPAPLSDSLSYYLESSYVSSYGATINRGLGIRGGSFRAALSEDKKRVVCKTVVPSPDHALTPFFKSYMLSIHKRLKGISSPPVSSSSSIAYKSL